MATRTLISAEEFDRLPEEEGRRYELLDGELIEVASATPGHNVVEITLGASLQSYLAGARLKAAVLPVTEFALGGNRRLQPDLAVIFPEKWARVDRWKVPVMEPPDIAVEIVSPSESASHLDRKVEAYLAAGASEVWVIFPDGPHMYVHTLAGARRLAATDRLDSALLPGWSIAVGDLFASL
jgi:Uma2 family endonuclease